MQSILSSLFGGGGGGGDGALGGAARPLLLRAVLANERLVPLLRDADGALGARLLRELQPLLP